MRAKIRLGLCCLLSCLTTASSFAGDGQQVVTNGKIAFASDQDGDYEIYIMDANGSHIRQLTFNDTNDMWPTWSPDGTKIAFMSRRTGHPEIFVMEADGSNQISLTRGEIGYAPAWSPLGDKIAFTSDRGTAIADVYVMNADGSNPVNLTQSLDARDEIPSWSFDGTEIIFRTTRERESQGYDPYFDAYVMNGDGSNQRKLMTLGFDLSPITQSPDGSKIVLAIDGLVSEIYVADANGSNPTKIPPDDEVIGLAPRWSPDGEQIVFSTHTGTSLRIAVMNADGSDFRYLTMNKKGRAIHPAWQPLVNEPTCTDTPTLIKTPTRTPRPTATPIN